MIDPIEDRRGIRKFQTGKPVTKDETKVTYIE